MKGKVSFVLAAVMAIEPAAFAKKKQDGFTDMGNHWSRAIVMRLDDYGVVSGYGDGTFRPEKHMSVAEFLKMMMVSMGYSLPNGDIYWASEYINKAVELGIIESGDFADYNQEINRLQMARIVANALGNKTSADEYSVKSQIYDYAEIPEDYKEDVIVAVGEKIIVGYEDGSFRPWEIVTRAQASAVMVRFIEKNGGIKKPTTDKPGTGDDDQTLASAKIYVATNGNDNASGTESSPYKTIGKAKEAVRNMISSGKLPQDGVTVYLRGGTYYMYDGLEFTEEDSGTEESPITYTAYPGESVTISGETPIDVSWFKEAGSEAKSKLIDKSAQSKLMMVDLKAHGITDYGEMSSRGYHYFNKGRYAQAELIVNGENQTLARYPNEGTMPVPKENVDSKDMAFTYTDSRVSKWKDAKDPYIVGTISINYENNTYPVAKIDTAKSMLYVKMGRINTYYTNGWFYGTNLMEEIDQEGEYYIDRDEGILYYYPPADFKTGNYTVGLSTLKKPVFNFNGTNHINVSNITMEGGRGYAILGTSAGYKIPTYKEFAISQNMNLDGPSFNWDKRTDTSTVYLGDVDEYTDAQVFPGHVWDGFVDNGKGVDGISVKNCNIFNFGSGGVVIKGDNVKIENNHMKNLGGTGLYLRGGDLETLTPSGDTIINNKIHNVGYLQKAYVPAIAMHGVAIHVANNDIYDAPHCIFNYHGNDHIIEFNKIHDAVKECLDMDAIYTRNEYMPQWRGNIIRNNYIYNLGIFPVGEYTKQLNVSGIRTDNYGHALQIYNNIFANIGTENANNVIGVTAQGNRNTLTGNIFVDCSATYLGWGSYSAGATWNMENQTEKERVELAEKYAANPIFAAKYPELATFRQEYYKSVATNVFDKNLVVNIKFGLSTTNGEVNKSSTRGAAELIKGDNNIVTTKDPGFVNYAAGDYTLKDDSEVFTKIPGFEKIEMSKMGNNAPVGPIN